MKFYTVLCGGKEVTAAAGENGCLYSLEILGVQAETMNSLIENWQDLCGQIKDGIEKVNADPDAYADKALTDYKILAPIPEPRQDVVCLGVNYHDHKKEAAAGIDFVKTADTIYFAKRVNRANDPEGLIPNYNFVDSLDYEAELGVIIGKDAFHVTPEEAGAYIFGYTVINDVSARNVQKRHQQWYLGKSLDGYTPMGPCIVTADEIGDPHALDIRCYVNGELRQNSNTKYMITTVEEAISELSQGMTLQCGTIIATGTPAGVAMGMNPPVWLKSGDKVCCEIEKIGVLENFVE